MTLPTTEPLIVLVPPTITLPATEPPTGIESVAPALTVASPATEPLTAKVPLLMVVLPV